MIQKSFASKSKLIKIIPYHAINSNVFFLGKISRAAERARKITQAYIKILKRI